MGSAIKHINHPYEIDRFEDIIKILNHFNNDIEVKEKIDGVSLFMGKVNGQFVFKKTPYSEPVSGMEYPNLIKNEEIRNIIRKAISDILYYFEMSDLDEGQWIAMDVIHPDLEITIPYNTYGIVIHGSWDVDSNQFIPSIFDEPIVINKSNPFITTSLFVQLRKSKEVQKRINEFEQFFEKTGIETVSEYLNEKWIEYINDISDRYMLNNRIKDSLIYRYTVGKSDEGSLRYLRNIGISESVMRTIKTIDANYYNKVYDFMFPIMQRTFRIGNDIILNGEFDNTFFDRKEIKLNLIQSTAYALKYATGYGRNKVSDVTRNKIMRYFNDLRSLYYPDSIDKHVPATEGVVDTVDGQLIKLTGMFALLHRIKGSLMFNR